MCSHFRKRFSGCKTVLGNIVLIVVGQGSTDRGASILKEHRRILHSRGLLTLLLT